MALTLLLEPEYQSDVPEVPDVGPRIVTARSSEYLTLPQPVAFANYRKSVLQSAAEAITLRLAANTRGVPAPEEHVER